MHCRFFLLFSIYSIFFAILESYRAEFLKLITSNEQMPKRQSISISVNTAVVIVGSLSAGFLSDKINPSTMYLITAGVYVLPSIVILLSRNFYPAVQIENDIEDNNTSKNTEGFFTNKTFIFIGSIAVSFFGGAASLLILSYILNTLHSTAFYYTILTVALSAGGVIGSLLVNIRPIKNNLKILSSLGMLCIGLLLFLVILKPAFTSLFIILFVSGIISSLGMTYYTINLFTLYTKNDIRKKYNLLQIGLKTSEALSKPFAGFIEKIFGVIIAFIICGVGFIFIAPVNYLRQSNSKKSEEV